MRRSIRTLALAALLAAAPAFAQTQEVGVAARVNGVPIGVARLERAFEEDLRDKGMHLLHIRNPERMKSMKREVLNTLIDQELLWQEAKRAQILAPQEDVDKRMEQIRKGFSTLEAFDERLEREGYTEKTYREYLFRQMSAQKYVLDRVANKVSVDDDDLNGYYNAHPEQFQHPEEVRARHILIKMPPTASEAEKAAARERMAQVRKEIDAGGDFAELARRHSEDPGSAKNGGDLGFFGHGAMVKPFEDAAFALKPGQMSGVVESVFGLHVIRLEERRDAGVVPLEEVRKPLTAKIRGDKIRQAMNERLEELRRAAKIEHLMPL